ncbi:MAG TPA: GtrA family protein [Candidatus Paceibacterota bacterium]|nr:GtrA family protein [Candidatus Paceibacterota bacterium]
MSKRDYKIAFLIGIASSALWFFVLARLSFLSGVELLAVAAALPFLCMAAVAAAHALFSGKLFHKAVKFLMVGVLNTGIDFFVFNALIAATGENQGLFVTLFKSISFLFAMFNSYEWNRWWTFGDVAAPSRNKREFARFAAVTFVGFLVNVGSTTLIVAAAHPSAGISQVRLDNIAAGVATALNLAWNFIGYKLFVFRSAAKRTAEIIIDPNVI